MKHFTTKTRLARAAMMLLVALLGSVTGAWAQQTLPYSYGFEDDLATAGWTTQNPSGLNASEFGIYSNAAKTGSNGFRFSSYSDKGESTQYLISPELNAPKGVIVQFFYSASYSSSSGETFQVGYSTTDTQISSFTFGSAINAMNADWVQTEEFVFPAGTKYVAVYYSSNYIYRLYVDDFTFLADDYPKPTALTVSNLTSNGATISWTASANGSPTHYAYQYKKATDEEWSALATTTETSVSISSLAVATAYNFRVKAVYGTDGESDFVSKNFATECAAYDIPYTYGFEDAAPFDCWTVISGNVSRQSGTTNSDSYRLDFRGTTSNMIALPQFTEPTNTLRVEFYTRPESTGGSSGKFAIGYMTDITDASTFVAVETYNSTEMTTSYVKKTVDFASAPANAIIAMRQFDCQTNYYWYVDDVTVKEIPSCLAPTALNAGNITPTSTELSWTSDANAWTVYYKKSSDGTYNEVANVTANPYTLNGLDAASYYQFYVVANCSATDTSEPSEVFAFCTAINSYPWTENFDGITVASSSTPTLPLCWSYINTCTNNSYKYYPTINSSNATSTPNS
ncbi:MAG: choice-of-anchor J domain-containing protein, partial [Bacteroidales bacterium]|nr:choice-of-anchor J domain-containing protein [Bacteroidales bacterium]